MKLDDSTEGLFRCDCCGGTIAPFERLIIVKDNHLCSVECYEKFLGKKRVCRECRKELNPTQQGFLTPVTKNWFCNPRCHYQWTLEQK
jgi:hypothetical protein